MKKNEKTLSFVDIDPRYIEAVDKYLVKFFRDEIYSPLLAELKDYGKIQNSKLDLLRAIQQGRISYYRGVFSGSFNASITRELKKMGAKWSRKDGGVFRIHKSQLPSEVSMAISTAESSWLKKNDIIQKKLGSILSADIASKIDLTGLADKALFKVDGDIQKSYQGLVVSPELTEKNRIDIAKNYTNNMQYYIQQFTQEEVTKLRDKIKDNVFSGKRYDTMVKTIKASYGVSESKAQFLARQETKLLVAKFKESRYNEVGIDEYIWQTVVGSPAHPVREDHARLNGTRQRYSNPPVVNKKGDRKNPGEDFGCRCRDKPIVKF